MEGAEINMKKVMVGMSGGVDSSVAAKLLYDEGYEVTGVTLKLFDKEALCGGIAVKCSSLTDIDDAKSVADKLGFEHLIFNFEDEFREKVMNKFTKTYLEGETPNPCIECNKHIKFEKMLEKAEELGYDYIATGHYAVREFDEITGKFILKRPADRSKDQTYVLYGLTQYQLSKTLFPLGSYEKSQIRKIAEKAELINSDKPDSQDICFVPDGDYAAFIEKKTGVKSVSGDFIDLSGKILGKHRGVIHYTIGQRKGLGISLGAPAYVTNKDSKTNTVTLGSEEDLYKTEIRVSNINLISYDRIDDGMKVTVKTRYSQNEQEAMLYNDGEELIVRFSAPQRAPAPGQAAVFYDGDIVIGGGTIRQA